MKREIDIALDAQKKLLLRLIKNPEEFDKLPKKGVLLPKQKVIIPYRQIKTVGEFLILPGTYSLEKLKKGILPRR